MAKYLTTEPETAEAGEAAFRQALDLNPDLAIAHKFTRSWRSIWPRGLMPWPVLRGRRERRIRRSLPLDSPLRYCGLLGGIGGRLPRAVALEPTIRTALCIRGSSSETISVSRQPSSGQSYIVALSLARGRGTKRSRRCGL